MSNDTQNSRESGNSRNRRSRGGQNRRSNNNSGRQQGEGQGRQSGGGRRNGGRQGSSKSFKRPMPKPVELNWWQKLLKSIGLYKEPTRPPRPERRPDKGEAKKREPRKSKTRDNRSDSSDGNSERPKGRNNRGGRDSKRPRGGDPSTVENRRVYVGNLSYDTTESDLEELFKGVGAVRRVEIVYNRSTHRSKGYGFVEMLDIDEAKRTVEVLHDQFFMGRELTVSGAKSKDHADAESDDEKNTAENNIVPPLAPINPNGDSQPTPAPVEEKVEQPEAKIDAMEEPSNVPTEEFSPQENKS